MGIGVAALFSLSYVITPYPAFVYLDWLNIVPYLPNDFSCNRCSNFTYRSMIENPEVCSGNGTFLLMLVMSSPANSYFRDRVRDTWGSVREHRGYMIRILFVLARPRSKGFNEQIQAENEKYKDILQGDFNDSYMTLTNKTIWGLNWVSRRCSNVRFVLKTDDDVLNVPQRFVDLLSPLQSDNYTYVGGFCRSGKTPDRKNIKTKWFTPPEIYSASYYPTYCNGPAYVLSMAAVRQIVDVYTNVRFLPWEDVYVTGLCRAASRMDYNMIDGIIDSRPISNCELTTTVVSIHKRRRFLETWRAVMNDVSQAGDCERLALFPLILGIAVVMLLVCGCSWAGLVIRKILRNRGQIRQSMDCKTAECN